MYFDSLSALLAMDGHGGYVWSVYGLVTLVIIFLVLMPINRKRRLLVELQGQMRREQGLSKNSSSKNASSENTSSEKKSGESLK